MGRTLRHVVMFRWKAGTSEETTSAIVAALGELPGLIPELRSYHFGADAGVREGNYDFAVVAEFDSVDDYLAYSDHPRHRQIVEDLVAPHVDARASVQFAD